ncbi:MAG: hypothetical protein JSV99_11645 [Planctomycetota bacterium]|nr:MAG: hypothetical protein JSV99_11645 [Planctomycetota bacterium]
MGAIISIKIAAFGGKDARVKEDFWGKNAGAGMEVGAGTFDIGLKMGVGGAGKVFQSVPTCEKFGKTQKKLRNGAGISLQD